MACYVTPPNAHGYPNPIRYRPTLHAQTEKVPYCITPPQQRRKSA